MTTKPNCAFCENKSCGMICPDCQARHAKQNEEGRKAPKVVSQRRHERSSMTTQEVRDALYPARN